jgi:heparosan-N-sulfate-glucuronate 5-epimerase
MTLSKYMVDYRSRKIPPRLGPLDGSGIPMFDPRNVRLAGPPVYHPIVIIQYALAHYELALEGSAESEKIFLRCAGWIEDHALEESQHRFLVWQYGFPLRTPPVSPPWISGLAQGQALSLLARSFQKTHSARTAEVAHRAARSFLYSVSEGGVISRSDSGAFFIEEVACLPAIHILNGCLYALFGIYEYLHVFEDTELQSVFEKSLQGVDELLPAFDLGWWSSYSLGLRWNMATMSYHDTHICQLKHLAVVLNRPQFDVYATRWDAYRQSASLRGKRTILGMLEVNVNRLLTIFRLDGIQYRQVKGLKD